MNVLIASDSFKGSLSSVDVCNLGEVAIKEAIPGVNVMSLPLADGGEGTVDSLVINTGGTYKTCMVKGPYGREIEVQYGILGNRQTAVIEMASASGIILAKKEELNPLIATSYGTGQLILDAIHQGCKHIIMGIGGSATNDGGVGMLQALGFEFLNESGESVGEGGQFLGEITTIKSDKVEEAVLSADILVACDVNNPLCGEKGATMVYGPQKGATPEMLKILEDGMVSFGQLVDKTFDKNVLTVSGAGAAGGMGAGLLGFLKTRLASGFSIISETIGLEEIIKENSFDVIFTGEGQLNSQTLNGKLPFGISTLGKKYGIPVIAIVGSMDTGFENMYDEGLAGAFSIINQPMSLESAVKDAGKLLKETYYNVAKIMMLKK